MVNFDENQTNIINLFKSDNFELAEILAISNGYGVWFNEYIKNFCNEFLNFINFDINRCNNIYEVQFKDFGWQKIFIDSEMFAHYVVLQMFYYKRPFLIETQISGYLLVNNTNFGCFLNGYEFYINYEDFRKFANLNAIRFGSTEIARQIEKKFNISCKII